ncbi:MAG: FG-GAP-like repeat-containing protein, partial [archaeon]
NFNFISKIYRNNNPTPNSIPTAPSGLTASVADSDVTFSWNKSTDTETPQNGLTYNLYVSTTPGGCQVKSPMADISSGYRKVVQLGNMNHCNSYTLKGLPEGKYYWSVQAIDNAFAGSSWATEQSFTIGNPPDITPPAIPKNLTAETGNQQVILRWQKNTEADFLRYRVYGGTSANPTTKIDSTTGGILDTVKVITGLTNGTTYYYRITAVDLVGNESGFSNEVIGKPTINTQYNISKIAFTSSRDGNSEIYVMNSDGTELYRLTDDVAIDGKPAWSYDGSKVIFVTNRDGNYEIYVTNADGSNPFNLTNNLAIDGDATWSPDGAKIAFRSDRDGNSEIYIMDVDGTNVTRLTNNGAIDNDPDWSPSGSKIAFTSNRDGNEEIYTMNSDGSNQIRFTNQSGADRQASWSPDGTKIAFTGNDPSGAIWIMNADGSNVSQLNASGSDPDWSPAGTKITFACTSGSNDEVFVMNSDGTNPTNLTNNSAVDTQPSWSPFLPPETKVPAAPQNLTALSGNQQVTLKWQKNTDDDFLRYRIYGGTSANPTTKIDSTTGGILDTVKVITGLTNGTTYYYRITAVDSAGNESNYSNEVSTTPSIFTEQTGISLTGVDYSSVVWGDYDNDGDLDILLTGYTGSTYVSKIYRNNGNNSFTEQTGISLTGVVHSSVAWGDYDNDGDLDILLTGYTSSGSFVSKIYRNNGNNSFTEQTGISLTGVDYSSVAWGDYDNDGDLDILLTGRDSNSNNISKICRNNGNNSFTEQTGISLKGVYVSSVAWGDYDNDGDLDILLTGRDSNSNNISKIYRNNGSNSFTEQTEIGVTGVCQSSVAWGDYDNDGDLDILLTGIQSYGTNTSKIYRNNGDNSFTEQTGISLIRVGFSSAAWGDYDNDGDLDILLTGSSSSDTGPYVSKIYINNGDNSFTEQTGIGLTGVDLSSVAWGDYDNDGDLDILLTGSSSDGCISKIYRNDNLTSNSVPSAPSGLTASVADSNVTFSWDKSSDTETPQNGLTYNLYVSMTPGGCQVKSPMADISSGYRKVVQLGNVDHCNSNTLKDLPEGKYYWSVQAIDNAFAGSAFAPEQTYTIDYTSPAPPQNLTALSGNQQVTLLWQKNTESDFLRYCIYGGTSVNPTTKIDSTTGGVLDTVKIITGLTNGTTCYYRITAVDSAGNESGYSNEVSAIPGDYVAPAIPQDLIAIPESPDIHLKWGANTENDYKKYKIYRGQNSPATIILDSLVDDRLDTVYFDKQGVTLGQIYFYRITAVDTAGNESGFSNEVSATVYKINLVASMETGEQSGDIPIQYQIANYPFPIGLKGEYRRSPTDSWHLAHVTGDTSQITPENFSGSLIWNSTSDLNSVDLPVVNFQLTCYSYSYTPGVADTLTLHLDNFHSQKIVLSMASQSEFSGDVAVNYVITDAMNDTLKLRTFYSTNGATWTKATIAEDSTGYNPTKYSGTIHWKSSTDLAGQDFPTVYVKVVPNDFWADGIGDTTAAFHVDNNQPPAANLANLTGTEYSGDVTLNYVLTDTENNTLSFSVYYWNSGWKKATVTGDTSGITNTKYSGSIVWKSATDLSSSDLTTKLKLVPRDGDVGAVDSTNSFHLDNYHLQKIVLSMASQSKFSGDVAVNYVITDATNDTLKLRIFYSTNGTFWSKATIAEDSTGYNPTKYSGTIHWKSSADLVGQDFPTVYVKVVPNDYWADGIGDTTAAFHLDNNQLPTVTLTDLADVEHSGDVTLNYVLTDAENNTLSFSVYYWNSGWKKAMVTGDTSGITSMKYSGSIVWKSAMDLPTNDLMTRLKLVPRDNDSGSADSTTNFHLDNNLPPSVIIAEISGEKKDAIPITFSLVDTENDTLAITCDYLDPVTQIWKPATVTGQTAGISIYADRQIFWQSLTDLPTTIAFVLFRISPADDDAGTADTVAILLDNIGAPAVAITNPFTGELSGDISISFQISDDEGDAVTLTPEYSLNSGANWSPATVSGKIARLTQSEYSGSVIWNSAQDAPGIDKTTVRFRLTPADAHSGLSYETADFHLDNNQPPSISLNLDYQEVSGDVTLPIVITDAENDSIRLEVFYSQDQTNWQNASTNIAGKFGQSSYSGNIIWYSETDLPRQDIAEVWLKITCQDIDSGIGDTVKVHLDNQTGPKVQESSPEPNSPSLFAWIRDITVTFDRDIDTSSVSSQIELVSRISGGLDFTHHFNTKRSLVIDPTLDFVSLDTISVTLRSGIRDEYGVTLDGNQNGDPDGSPADDWQITFRTTLLGDYNLDKQVTLSDFEILRNAWLSSPPDYSYELGPVAGTLPHYRLTRDGKFNIYDLASLGTMWNWYFENHDYVQFLAKTTTNQESPINISTSFNKGSVWNSNRKELTLDLDLQANTDLVGMEYVIDYNPEEIEYQGFVNRLPRENIADWLILDKCLPEKGQIGVIAFCFGKTGAKSPATITVGSLQFASKTASEAEIAYTSTLSVQAQDTNRIIAKQARYRFSTKPPTPERFALHPAFPNPFNQSTTIRYEIPKETFVRIVIYNLNGEVVSKIAE